MTRDRRRARSEDRPPGGGIRSGIRAERRQIHVEEGEDPDGLRSEAGDGKGALEHSRGKRDVSLPREIYAQASPTSIGGSSLFDATAAVTAETVDGYMSEQGLTNEAVMRLRDAGFRVLDVSPVTINIAGPPSAYERAFGTRLVTEEREVIKGGRRRDTATFIDTDDTAMSGLVDTSRSDLADVLEGVAIERPVYPFAANAFAPPKSYWHLSVPGDVSLGVNADRAHRGRVTGRGVRLAMVDSGWFEHPYFGARGYRADPVVLGPAASKPKADESGHGTGESANAFAVAPDIRFQMVKMSFTNSTGAFNKAVALHPDIISNSWGSDIEQGPLSAADKALAAAIAQAVASGIAVVFSAGNGHWGFPGQHPDVISAGGVYVLPDGDRRASNYSSGFASKIYANRDVPDVSGLVGEVPRAAYIMLPVEPGDQIDQDLAGSGNHPQGDETKPADGWAAFSGTSAAAPQVAGVCALIRQAAPGLSPQKVRRILMCTANDVTAGTNAHWNKAKPGFDLATGSGLVNAHRAVLLAKVQAQSVDEVEAAALRAGGLHPAAVATKNGEPLDEEDVAALETLIGEADPSLSP